MKPSKIYLRRLRDNDFVDRFENKKPIPFIGAPENGLDPDEVLIFREGFKEMIYDPDTMDEQQMMEIVNFNQSISPGINAEH